MAVGSGSWGAGNQRHGPASVRTVALRVACQAQRGVLEPCEHALFPGIPQVRHGSREDAHLLAEILGEPLAVRGQFLAQMVH